jgi:hypothetical protein
MRLRVVTIALASLIGTMFMGGLLSLVPSVAAATTDPSSTGYIEICKTFTPSTAGTPNYQGTFTYTISAGGKTTSASVKALLGGPQVCTSPIAVASGTATVTEVAAPWFSVASITRRCNGNGQSGTECG